MTNPDGNDGNGKGKGNGHLPDHQRHYIASCVAAGYPVQLIAKATGLDEDKVERHVRTPSPPLQVLIDHYRFQQQAQLVKFKMETSHLVEEGRVFVENYIKEGSDARLRYDMVKDIWSAHGLTIPRDRASAPQVNTQLNVYGDQRTVDAMQTVAQSIRESTESLKDSLPQVGSIAGSRHITVSAAESKVETVKLSDLDDANTSQAPAGASGAPQEGAPKDGSSSG